METVEVEVFLPEELLAEIDALVGPEGRDAFFAEVAMAEVKRRIEAREKSTQQR